MEHSSVSLIAVGSSYEDYRKAELEVALDEHLRTNSSIFSGDKRLADYYKRLSQPTRISSPIKKDLKIESSTPTDEVKKVARRRNTKVKDDPDVTCVSP
jgi:hypothetical protein